MSFSLQEYQRIRPFLYHLTAKENLTRIARTMALESAERLANAAGRARDLDAKRPETCELKVGGEVVLLRDQSPLHQGNLRLEGGWCFSDLLACLNERVFLWAGREIGPISYGDRHYQRYESERPVILRIAFDELMAADPSVEPLFAKYNSGSPRCSNGIPSPRGPSTFVSADVAPFRPSQVVEVTFLGMVHLPVSTQVGNCPSGPWCPLSHSQRC